MSTSHGTALFYPHTEIRDANWLKAALLYWDKGVRRIVPSGYIQPDSDDVRAAEHLVRSVSPEPYLDKATGIFNGRLDAVLRELPAEPSPAGGLAKVPQYDAEDYQSLGSVLIRALARKPASFDSSLAQGIHLEKMQPILREQLLERGLAHIEQDVFIMNRALVAMYMTILADVMSKDARMPIITDHPSYAKFGRRVAYGEQATPSDGDALSVLFSLEIDFPTPEQLARIPMSKVLQFRERRLAEMKRFRKAVGETIPAIVSETDALARETLLAEAHSEIKEAMSDYRRLMFEMSVDAVKGALSISVPSAIGLVVHTPIAIAAGLTVSTAFVIRDALVKRANTARANNYQYLLELKKLTTAGGVS
jgi:hypothetical protein